MVLSFTGFAQLVTPGQIIDLRLINHKILFGRPQERVLQWVKWNEWEVNIGQPGKDDESRWQELLTWSGLESMPLREGKLGPVDHSLKSDCDRELLSLPGPDSSQCSCWEGERKVGPRHLTASCPLTGERKKDTSAGDMFIIYHSMMVSWFLTEIYSMFYLPAPFLSQKSVFRRNVWIARFCGNNWENEGKMEYKNLSAYIIAGIVSGT